MRKFIKLFEDFEKDLKAQRSETQHTWTDVRDAIQMKRPFVIIVFRTKDSYLEALQTDLSEYDYIKQTAFLLKSGDFIKYPSVFFTMDQDMDFSTKVRKLYEDFEIKQIIIGEANSEYAKLYAQDGSSSEFGNEIISGLSKDEFASEDHFKVGSTYYRFLAFEG